MKQFISKLKFAFFENPFRIELLFDPVNAHELFKLKLTTTQRVLGYECEDSADAWALSSRSHITTHQSCKGSDVHEELLQEDE